MRNFNIGQQFQHIKEAAISAVQSIFPIEKKIRRIELEDVWVEDNLDPSDYSRQGRIKARGGTFGVPVYAKLKLIDRASRKVIDRSDRTRLFVLPKVTSRYSYIVGGNEYQVQNQLRLKSGVYTLRKQNGELKTSVNLARGKNFDLTFNEATGIFSITKVGGGQANIPLYPILTHLGLSHSFIEKSWGSKIAAANKGQTTKAIDRATKAFGLRKGVDLKTYFSGNTAVSGETTKATLGKSFDKVSGEMLLSSSKKLLDVHLGKKDPEDRDSLEFKELHSLEDFIKERLEKNKNTLAFKIKRNIDNPKRTKISQIINPGAFSSVIESFFTQDDKSATPEQTNPLDMLSGQYKVTIMGSGGIRSDHAVTPEMREIHPTHYGFLDPIATPESKKIGANLHIPLGAVKDGKNIKVTVVDSKGKTFFLNPMQAFNEPIGLPNQKGTNIKAIYRGKAITVPKSKVRYYTPSPQALFTWSSNLVPYLPSDQGNRAMMASKMMEQAIALKHREEPLVQVGTPAGVTIEEAVGREVAITAPTDGVIKKVTPDNIVLKTKEGDVKINRYNNFTLNRKSYLHHEMKVKEGDRVKKGDLLADSNFTKDGVLSLGTNLRTAYLPYQGLNFEDGIIITDTAADRLTSVHIHKKALSVGDNTILSLPIFRTQYPNLLTPENLNKLDKEGVMEKGQVVKMGEAVIAALQRREASARIGIVKKQLADRPRDISVYWNFEDDGKIVDVQKTGKKVTVLVKTEERAKIGDKLSGRHGNKGIITKIISEGEAPKDKDGKPVDVLLNPHGVISRINVGQIYESAAGKAARKNKKTHVVDNFSGEDYLESTKKLLKKSKVDDKEELFDPQTGKSLGRVHVGDPYLLKLYKLSTSNFSTRQGGPGHPYDINLQPLKGGGEEGSKSLDLLTMYSMLSHGARANLREMTSVKANQNDEYWKALKSGQNLPPPKSPFVYDKLLGYLKGAGIDVRKDGTKLTLAPLTDKEILRISAGEVEKPIFYSAKDMEPKKGGFFDPVKFGGFKGDKWGHIRLKEPTVNPVFETAVRKVTGLGKKYDKIMGGELFIDKNGEFNTEGRGKTGGAAIEQILSGIDVAEEIKILSGRAKTSRGASLDDVNKKLRYLKALQTNKVSPVDAYIRKVVPVVPPIYRPLYPLPDGNVTTSDVNFLYQNLGVLNTIAKLPVMDLLPEGEKADIRKDVYEHMKGVSGLTDLNIKGRVRSGLISEIKGGTGGQPKEGFFQDKVIGKRQDYVGRGTIIPEPTLGVDEVAVPEHMAWKLFEPFVIRELKNFGKTPNQAVEEIKIKSELAKKALDMVMKDRNVLLNRAPSLHKFSVMGFKPRLTEGTAIKIPPLVVKGFNADFDGDTMTVHVPISDEANEEAGMMMPSRNLYQPGSGKLMISPSQEAQIGLYYLSKTPVGRDRINKILGPGYNVKTVLNKRETSKFLTELSKKLDGPKFGQVLSKLKSEGEKYAFESGFTLGIEDLSQFKKARDMVVTTIDRLAKKAKTQDDLSKLSDQANTLVDKIIRRGMANKSNPLYDMVESGARGSPTQLRSIVATPMFVSDARSRIIPNPIKKSYAEGLDIGDYWTSMYGARKGMMDRAIQTSLPGTFSKDIMANTIDNVVVKEDCGTKSGRKLDINDRDVIGRFLAGSQGGVPHNTLIDQSVVNRLKKARFKEIKVRSPLTCLVAKGICQKCFGMDENQVLPPIGENMGAKAGQTMSEPLVQLVMNTFHTGGTAGTGADVTGYKRIEQLMQMPKIVAGSAALAPIAGTITKIIPGIAGGYDVYVNDKKAYVSRGLKLKVKVGSVVSAGDPLSTGVIKPQDLVKHKGMMPAQEYVSDELKKAYSGQGVNIDGKIFETVVRSLGNTTKINNNPKHADVVPGDIVPYTRVRAYNKNLVQMIPTEEAVGLYLNKPYATLNKGIEITGREVKLLKALGHKEVEVTKDPISHTPVLKSINTLPLLKKDWMGALGYRNLAKALVEGAGQAWSTDLEGYHPIPAFAHGARFGKGKEGKY